MLTEPENPRADWATLVSRRAKAVFPNRPENTLAGLLQCSPWEVGEWLSGQRMPDIAMHAGLMDALSLRNTVDDIAPKQLQGLDIQLAILRTRLDDLYTKAMDGQNRTAPIASGTSRISAIPKTRRTSEVKQGQRAPYRDHEAIVGLRVHHGGIPYEDLSDTTLRDYMATTKNAHEYLRCYRIAKGFKQKMLTIEVMGSYKHNESGGTRTTPELLTKIKEHIFGSDIEAYEHFVNLSIMNRQKIIEHCLSHNDIEGVLTEKESMPPVYWQKSIERFLYPAEWEALPNKPEWQVEDIKSQGQYFRAIRRALPEDINDTAKAVGKHIRAINGVELDIDNMAETRQKLVVHYKAELFKRGLNYDLAYLESPFIGRNRIDTEKQR